MKLRVLSLLLLFSLLISASADVYITAEIYVRPGGGTLNLRSQPTTESESLGIVHHGDPIEIYQSDEEWSYIYSDRLDCTGYIKTKYITNIEYHGEEQQGVYPSYTPLPSYGDAEAYEAPCTFELDLDGDGTQESVTFETYPVSEYEERTQLIVFSENGNEDTFVCDIHSGAQVWFVKLDGTGRAYMFLSGDEMSSDFATYCLFWDGSAIKLAPFFSPAPYSPGQAAAGAVTNIQNGIVTICDHRDMFGTWFASLDYGLNGSSMQYLPNPVWIVSNDLSDPEIWEYRALTAKTDLPAMSFDSAATIPKGTKLLLSAIDDFNSRAYFISDSGRIYSVEYAFDADGWTRTLDGIPEDECFENLLYAG